MKTMLCGVLLLSAALAFADTANGVQAVPSDQIRYPDASEVLNKADPQASKTLPVNKLMATKPVPAQTIAPVNAASTAAKGVKATSTEWYLKWTMPDEASARSWASSLTMPADVSAAGSQWQVVAGPLNADGLKLLSAQAGKAVLVRN